MSHRMGMDVVGDPANVKAFRYACSSSFSLVEYWVGQALFPSDNPSSNLLGSVTLGLGYKMLNGEPLEIFESNGYTIIRAVGDNQRLLIIDPATGIVMDIGTTLDLNDTISGTRCYGDQQTEWANGYGNAILNNKDSINRAIETGEDVATDYGQGSDEWQDEVLGFAGSTAISVGIAIALIGGPPGWIIGGLLIGAGLVSSWYAADMDEDMYSPSNQINFILNVGPSFIPFIGWESSIGGKLCVKTLTSKGVSKELFNIPKNYDGYVIQNIKSMGPDYTKGSLTGGSITSARYINHGSPEGVARITFGWTEKEAAKGITTNYLLNREAYVIDRNSDDIDGAFGYRKYNSTSEYLATA
ncbi:MAG: hypothetical protein HVN35_08790 [Methanobacteriaceae archaeon]|nr:hypothetical protein [Methanobacteriaceae archaeon]